MGEKSDFKKTKKVYEDLIDFGFFGSDENYSMTGTLIELLSEVKEIDMREYLSSWEEFLESGKDHDVNFYVHIPYCVEKCHYCFSQSGKLENEKEVEDYVNLLINYLNFFADYFQEVNFSTFYMGGGNPSIMPEKYLDKLLKKIFSNFNFSEGGQRTIESDPRTVTERKMKIMKSYGINRLSMGIQSLNQDVLEANNRLHQKEEKVEKAIRWAKKINFQEFNVDLMVGMHGDNKKSLINSFKRVAEMGPDTISLYQLQPMKGYLNNIIKKTRKEFFEDRKILYEKSLAEIKKIAKENNYNTTNQAETSDDFNDADSVKFSKNYMSNEFDSIYIPDPVEETHSILGVGQGAVSFIHNKIKCKAVHQLTERPKDYLFSGYEMNSEKGYLYFLITNFSNRKKIKIENLKKELEPNHFEEMMKIFKKLEKEGLVAIGKKFISLKFKNAREKLLYSLFFFPAEDIMNLVDRMIMEDGSTENCSKSEILSQKKPLTEKDIEEIKGMEHEFGGRLEGALVSKTDNEIIISNTDKEVKKVKYNPEEIIVVETFLDESENFNSFLKSKGDIDKIKKGDSLNLKINEDKDEALLIEKIVVAE